MTNKSQHVQNITWRGAFHLSTLQTWNGGTGAWNSSVERNTEVKRLLRPGIADGPETLAANMSRAAGAHTVTRVRPPSRIRCFTPSRSCSLPRHVRVVSPPDTSSPTRDVASNHQASSAVEARGQCLGEVIRYQTPRTSLCD